MITITITVEDEATRDEIYDVLTEAEENGEINAAFNLQSDETYDPDAEAYSDGDSPSEPFIISDFDGPDLD